MLLEIYGEVLALLIIFVIGVTFFVSINSPLEIDFKSPIGISTGRIFGKLKIILGWILKIRSFNKQTFLRRIGKIGNNCQIHPTAVIEGCDIADDVVVGPYSVLRGSVIGKGSKIEEHATVNISVVGENCQIGRYATANLCLLYPESLISHGGGLQGCVLAVDLLVPLVCKS